MSVFLDVNASNTQLSSKHTLLPYNLTTATKPTMHSTFTSFSTTSSGNSITTETTTPYENTRNDTIVASSSTSSTSITSTYATTTSTSTTTSTTTTTAISIGKKVFFFAGHPVEYQGLYK